jgi:hypothetical protein
MTRRRQLLFKNVFEKSPAISKIEIFVTYLHPSTSYLMQVFKTKITLVHRKIILIEGNAKCRQLKKLTGKWTLRQVFICLSPRTPCPPPSHTVYCIVYTCIQSVYFFKQGRGRGGRELDHREGKRGNSSNICAENTNMTDCISSL